MHAASQSCAMNHANLRALPDLLDLSSILPNVLPFPFLSLSWLLFLSLVSHSFSFYILPCSASSCSYLTPLLLFLLLICSISSFLPSLCLPLPFAPLPVLNLPRCSPALLALKAYSDSFFVRPLSALQIKKCVTLGQMTWSPRSWLLGSHK